MNNYVVYMHITPNNKYYIGLTQQDVKKRWQNGIGYKTQYFYRAIAKYGWDNIQHIIVAKGLTEDEATWLENQLILIFNSADKKYGYNISEGGYAVSEETKQKISKNRKGKKTGEEHYLYGQQRSQAVKDAISKANKGRIVSEETRKKIGQSRIGKPNPMSEETKKKIGEINKKNSSCKKKVICLTTNKIFDSISDAAKYYDIPFQGISLCCKGNSFSSGKYNNEKLQWRFLDENNNIVEPIIEKQKKQTRTRKCKFKPIICLTTKKMFCNIKEAQEFYNIKGNSTLADYFKKNKKYCGTYNGQKLQWKIINHKCNKKYKIKRCYNA